MHAPFAATSVALVAACSVTPAAIPEAPERPREADVERYYAIWLGGAQVGTAHETEAWSRAGVVVRRVEDLRFLRGDVPVTLATTIEITADRRLAPSQVTWTETARTVRHGEAVRDATGWTVTDAAGIRRLPHDAIPAELVPLVVRRDGRFAGGVFLPARGFVAGAGRIDPVAPNRLIARLVLETDDAGAPGSATAEATIDLADDAMPARVVDGEGVIATRIPAAQAGRAFEPVDLIAATSIPLSGSPSERIVLEGLQAREGDAIPPVPGQALRTAPERTEVAAAPEPRGARRSGSVELALSPQLPGSLPPGRRGADRTRTIAALVAEVHARIVPDLAANPTSARAATSAVAGDCTTFALAYAALAAARAIPTLIVTGFRVDGDRLVRHRWAVSWTGRAWIAVDAAFGTAPAGGDLVGLAIHDADDAGLLAGEAALTRVHAATWK